MGNVLREQIKLLEKDVEARGEALGRATARSQTSWKEQQRLCKKLLKLEEENFELEEELMRKESKRKKKKKQPTKRIRLKSWREIMFFKQHNRDVFGSVVQSCLSHKFAVDMSEHLQAADAYYGCCTRNVATGSVPVSADPEWLKEIRDEEEYITEEFYSRSNSSEDEDPSIGKQILPWYAM